MVRRGAKFFSRQTPKKGTGGGKKGQGDAPADNEVHTSPSRGGRIESFVEKANTPLGGRLLIMEEEREKTLAMMPCTNLIRANVMTLSRRDSMLCKSSRIELSAGILFVVLYRQC